MHPSLSLEKSKIKILLLEGVDPSAVESLKKAGYTSVEYLKKALDGQELLDKIENVHFIGIRSRTHLTREVLSHAKKLIGIGCFCIGTNQVDLKAAAEFGIPVVNAPFSNTRSVAELVTGEYLQLLRDIPASKKEMSKYLLDTLKEKGKELYLSINEASVKDIILPGEIRDIMNTVLVAEKRAQANVITRREEVASTRSLLNTARLMDENATLYKLKELEYVERICEKVGNININGGGDVLSQLTGMLSSNKNTPKNN